MTHNLDYCVDCTCERECMNFCYDQIECRRYLIKRDKAYKSTYMLGTKVALNSSNLIFYGILLTPNLKTKCFLFFFYLITVNDFSCQMTYFDTKNIGGSKRFKQARNV